MPTQQHEVIVEMFRSEPSLGAGLLADAFGIPVPEYHEARAASGDFTDVGPNEFRGDTALVLSDGDGKAVLGIVVEVQLGRDPSRQWAWPVYLSTLRARLRCPVFLMVVSPQASIATWCRTPIAFGHPGMVLHPLVLGPDAVPEVTDLDAARAAPERAVLSAMAHADGPHATEVLAAFLAGLHDADDEHAKMYYDLVAAMLSETARHRLEELMTMSTFKYEYQSDFARKYMAQGIAQGKAEGQAEGHAAAILAVLEARGVVVSDATRARITECTELEELQAWTRRAATADSESELFD